MTVLRIKIAKGAQFENEIKHLEKYKIDLDSVKEDHKEFIENNKSIMLLPKNLIRLF